MGTAARYGWRAMPDLDSLDQLLRARRSVRAFRPDPVSPELLRRVFTAAQQAPSNCNVQPWVVHVVSGEAAHRMRELLSGHVLSGGPASPDFEREGGYPGVYRERQIDAAVRLFSATGVAREDTAARNASMFRNFRFFDAPHAAFIFMPAWGSYREACDCGMYAQSLMLALAAAGLGSCAQGALAHHAALVRQELGVGEGMLLLFGLSFGYPDDEHPANTVRTTRAALEATTTFHGGEDAG